MELAAPSQASGGAATAARHGSGVVISVRVSMENDRIMFLVNQSGSTKAFLLGPTRITGGGGRRGVRIPVKARCGQNAWMMILFGEHLTKKLHHGR